MRIDIDKDILEKAYKNIRIGAEKDEAIPTFEWFCELVSDDTHIMYKKNIEPIYRIKKLKRII